MTPIMHLYWLDLDFWNVPFSTLIGSSYQNDFYEDNGFTIVKSNCGLGKNREPEWFRIRIVFYIYIHSWLYYFKTPLNTSITLSNIVNFIKFIIKIADQKSSYTWQHILRDLYRITAEINYNFITTS